GELLATMLTIDKVINHARLQRTRSIQCYQRNNVFEHVWLELTDQPFHAFRFKLEYCGGLSLLEQVEHFFIHQWNAGDIYRRFAFWHDALVNRLHSPVDNGQCF